MSISQSQIIYIYIYIYTGCIKKVDKSEIAFCFAKRLNVRCFFIKIDGFGTYNLEWTGNMGNLKIEYLGGSVFYGNLNMPCAQNLNA